MKTAKAKKPKVIISDSEEMLGFGGNVVPPDPSSSPSVGGTFTNGSVSAPSITFTNATDTGMYMEIVDTFPMLRFAVDGVAAGFIQYAPVVTNEGNGNTAIGYFAMWQADFTSVGAGLNTTNNSAFGGESSYSLTTGGQNSSFGSRSLWSNSTGNQNTALGQGALFYYTGSTNAAVGFHAGLHCTGGGCTFIGTECGEGAAPTTATGANNTAVGRLCMNVYTTATQCTVMGMSAGLLITSASGSTLVGYNCGDAISTGTNNCAMGSQALSAVQTVGENSAFGNNAGNAATSANGTFLGYAAGISVTTGADNTIVGRRAGFTGTALTTGARNTFIGTDCGVNANNLNDTIAIGYGAIATASGQCRIGNASLLNIVTPANLLLGGGVAGTSGAGGVLVLGNGATAPSTAVDSVQLFGVDLSAGNATLGIRTETAVAADIAVASTNSLTVVINGNNYRILLAT